jgi:hypothetical protein
MCGACSQRQAAHHAAVANSKPVLRAHHAVIVLITTMHPVIPVRDEDIMSILTSQVITIVMNEPLMILGLNI